MIAMEAETISETTHVFRLPAVSLIHFAELQITIFTVAAADVTQGRCTNVASLVTNWKSY
jgi:hypothetical protein